MNQYPVDLVECQSIGAMEPLGEIVGGRKAIELLWDQVAVWDPLDGCPNRKP